ncbi:DUF2161 domain-containing phosphodiesterase [Oricola indica]|jgi:hypothetical protein|uniref:DUF2161 domain-containing phosphodiesterase n=1 Tax=Oricola indica TaxID=2872591 RepID=UPI001CC0EF22|nr:DUF2161 family putative PD-(D/E)XK-type phosphodiesterase [Oricola indica]
MAKPKETDLYPPVKKLLEEQGYEVKSEIGAADVVGVRGDEPPLVVELKTGFTLSLFHQAIDRLAITDTVYVAVPRGSGRAFLSSLKSNLKLCRRLGLGLITVRMEDGFTEIHLDPGPYAPRKSKAKSARLLREFARRVGDPNLGGSNRTTIMTAYRQDAMRVAAYLGEAGPSKASHVARETGVTRARTIMADDHYGWFERVERGVYRLSPKGEKASGDQDQP